MKNHSSAILNGGTTEIRKANTCTIRATDDTILLNTSNRRDYTGLGLIKRRKSTDQTTSDILGL